MKLLICILILLSHNLAFSQSKTDWSNINRCFEQVSRDDYTHGVCDSNTHTLIKKCLLPYAKKAKVFFIINNNGKRGIPTPEMPVRTFNARNKDQSFNYHVFVELGGFILDMDYGNTPKPVSIKEYFKKMYGTQYNHLYSLKLTSAERYFKMYYDGDATYEEVLYELAWFDGVIPLNEYLKNK